MLPMTVAAAVAVAVAIAVALAVILAVALPVHQYNITNITLQMRR